MIRSEIEITSANSSDRSQIIVKQNMSFKVEANNANWIIKWRAVNVIETQIIIILILFRWLYEYSTDQ